MTLERERGRGEETRLFVLVGCVNMCVCVCVQLACRGGFLPGTARGAEHMMYAVVPPIQ